jgi:uncharacterized protein
MPRPIKFRRVEYVPENKYFAPCPKGSCNRLGSTEEIQLKVEELEAMRLKDIEGLNQEECAERMQVSRQTFQNIIDEARKKVATALVEDRAIYVGGGFYTKNVCTFKCLSCGDETLSTFEESGRTCKKCGSKNLVCNKNCSIKCET